MRYAPSVRRARHRGEDKGPAPGNKDAPKLLSLLRLTGHAQPTTWRDHVNTVPSHGIASHLCFARAQQQQRWLARRDEIVVYCWTARSTATSPPSTPAAARLTLTRHSTPPDPLLAGGCRAWSAFNASNSPWKQSHAPIAHRFVNRCIHPRAQAHHCIHRPGEPPQPKHPPVPHAPCIVLCRTGLTALLGSALHSVLL